MKLKAISKLLASLILLFILSCSQELDDLTKEQTLFSPAKVKSGNEKFDFENYGIIPLWENAVRLKNFVEVPYTLNSKLPRPKVGKDIFKNQGRERLLITTSGAKFEVFIIKYLPSSSFKGEIKKINSENVLSTNFDGNVSLQKVGEPNIRIWNIKNGKISKRSNISKVSDKRNARTSSTYVCEQWSQDTDWFQMINGEWIYTNTTTEYGETCSWVDDNSGGNNDPLDCIMFPNDPLCTNSGGNTSPTFNDYLNDATYADFLDFLTQAEKDWFILHPDRIPSAFVNTRTTEAMVNAKYSNFIDDNTNANAFKHAYWLALNTFSWGASAARELGIIHEYGPGSSNQHTMDLHNNELGITIALNNPLYLAFPYSIYEDILTAIGNGQGLRLNPNEPQLGNNASLVPTNGDGRRP